MAARPGRSVLSLQGVALADRQFSANATRLDLELPRGEVALIEVEDEHDAALLVDLCLGLADPGAGHVHFLGVDWTTRTPRERFHRRRRIGAGERERGLRGEGLGLGALAHEARADRLGGGLEVRDAVPAARGVAPQRLLGGARDEVGV